MKRLLTWFLAALLALLSVVVPAESPQVSHGEPVSYVDMQGFIHNADRLPWENSQAPPELLALSPLQHVSPRWVFTSAPMSFQNDLQTTLVPQHSQGSGTPTFNRASTAYQTDFEGKFNAVLSGEARFQGERRVANLQQHSEDCTQLNGGGTSNATVTATTVSFTNANSYWQAFTGSTGVTGHVYTSRIVLSSPDGATANLVLSTGTTVVNQSLVLTTTPTVYSLPNTAANTGSAITLYLDNRVGQGGPGQTGKTIVIANRQVEDVTGQSNQNPSEYVSVGVLSAPYHGAGVDGVQYFSTLNGNTVASNVVTEAVGAAIVAGQAGVASWAPVDAGGPFGYLSEGARADVLGTTAAIRRTMTDVGWVISNLTDITVTTTVGVDGVTASGARLTANANNATILFTPGLAGAVRTYSNWMKRITGTGAISMQVDVADGYTAKTLTANYSQYQVTGSSAVPVVGIKMATSGDVIDVDFNTLEAATFANPTPIPVNVSKAADTLLYAVLGNILNTTGTIYVEHVPLYSGAILAANSYILDAGTGGNELALYFPASSQNVSMYDAGTANTQAFTRTAGTLVKLAAIYTPTVTQTAVNGTLGTAAGSGASATLELSFTVATNGSSNGIFGTIRYLRIWLSALSNAQLTTQTAANDENWLMPNRTLWAEAANDDLWLRRANQ